MTIPVSSSSPDRPLVAVTGASGFIGRHVVSVLGSAGYAVRVLMRQQPAEPMWSTAVPEVVYGDLDDSAALTTLVSGAVAVVHLAGRIKARSRSGFLAVNRDGTATLAAIVREHAPAAHFLHVSSLAAREPQLSDYATSKHAGEIVVRQLLGDQVTILRPAAVYGPGDRETLVFFQLAGRRVVPVPAPAEARAAVIHVSDLARLVVQLIRARPCGAVLAAADARPQGYAWREILQTAAQALGNPRAKLFHAPVALLRTIALSGDIANRFANANMMTTQKLRELRHLDWSVPEAELAHPDGWRPEYDLASGFANAVRWYRNVGWLDSGTQGIHNQQ